MNIAFFGSSLVSAYWNGAATYYRGIIRALNERGHSVTFYEPDAWQRQQHRDIADPPWARVIVYPSREEAALACVASARTADLIIKASGVGVFDRLLEEAVLDHKTSTNMIVFWDVDAPATLDRIINNPEDYFHGLIPRYDAIFTYGGGDPVITAYRCCGARACAAIYNGLDPSTHFRVPRSPRFDASLSFLGNRLPDRETRMEEFFFKPAHTLRTYSFLLGGSGWEDKPKPANIQYIDHVYTRDHNAFNSSPLAVLNVTRDSMAQYGFSPATRVFEAAGAGACIISDLWDGIETFFEPDSEILLIRDADEAVETLSTLTIERSQEIGRRALGRVLSEHTYARRAEQVDELLGVGVTK